jgi:hypothetical protein
MDTIKPIRTLQVLDLVLEPQAYCDAFIGLARHDFLAHDAAEHLAGLLPLAIAQLDQVGDMYGVLALDELYAQLMAQPAV